jgi:hypothetical protein
MTKIPDIIPLAKFNFALLHADTYTRIKNNEKMITAKGTKYSTELFQESLKHWVDLEQIRKIETVGKNPKYHAAISHDTKPISKIYDKIIQESISKLNENYDNLKYKKLFDKHQLFLHVFSELDKIVSTIELAQWAYFETKNHNFEKDDLDKTITKGRKGIIKFCKKLLVGKTHKEIVLITDSCNKYPFTVF